MATWQCGLCLYLYDEQNESVAWEALPKEWICPVCGSGKESFSLVASNPPASAPIGAQTDAKKEYLAEWRRPSDDVEVNMADIQSRHRRAPRLCAPYRQ